MQIKFIFKAKDESYEIGDQSFDNFPCVPSVGDIFDCSSGGIIFDNEGIERFIVKQIVYRHIADEFLPVVVCVPE